MNASAALELTSEQEIVLMRKLKCLSEEHRNYLLKTYDLVGISKRINRYLSMERKENTMKENEGQCEKMYQLLRRGYFVDQRSVFDSYNDPNMYQYGTERCYATDDHVEVILQKPQVMKHENIKTSDNKGISITEYREQKSHDSTILTSLKRKSDDVAVLQSPLKRKYTCNEIETSPLHHNDTKKPKRFFEIKDRGFTAKKIRYNICDPQTFSNVKMNITFQ